MKKLIFWALLISSYFEIYAQNEPFRIDSIPSQGVLLDKGWKFHAGDNSDFSKPDFDDSQWESIDPTKDVMDLKQIPKDGKVIWLRLKMKIDTSLVNSIYGLNINQIGASEIYQNGKFLVGFGQINTNPDKNIAINPSSDPTNQNLFFVNFDKKTEVIYAIRFALQPRILFLKFMERPNPIFKLKLNTSPKANKYELERTSFDSTFMEYFRAGIFFILFLLHFALFILQTKILANLFTSIYYLFGVSFFILYSVYYHNNFSVQDRMAIVFIEYILAFGLSIMTLLIVYTLSDFPKSTFFWCIVFFPIVFYIFFIKDYVLSGIISGAFPIIMNIDAIRVTIISIYQKKRGSWLMFLGTFGWTLFYIFILIFRLVLDQNKEESKIIQETLFSISFFIFPVCVTLILARDFTNTSKSLEIKLVEIQQLSNEKQETLQRQNTELQAALLKGQTTERHRVAIDLHDNLGSTLTSIGFSMEAIDKSKMTDTEKDIYKNLQEMVTKAYNDVRLLSHNLLPEDFEKLGLKVTLESFIRKINKNSALQFLLNIDENFGRIDKKIEFELYSICLELVNNIRKHSKATEAKIELSQTGERIKLVVSDNGIGIFKNDSDGKGMKNVQARVDAIGAVWTVKSIENKGVVNEIVV